LNKQFSKKTSATLLSRDHFRPLRILVFLSHPAQFLFFKNAVNILRDKGHMIFILIKTKDVLSELLDEGGWDYYNILPKERGKSRLSILWSLLQRDIKIVRFAAKNKVDLLMGSDASLAHAGKLLAIPCITTLEDDYRVIRNLARLTYPFTSCILAPEVCDIGKWNKKKTGYPGYMKLAYLYPHWFKPDPFKAGVSTLTPYFLIRLSGLSAHHDKGISGISTELLDKIIERLLKLGTVFISSEKAIPEKYNALKLNISVSDIHHCLGFATLLICDSQSMVMEAAMLGTPSVRISSFAGRISVLEELEHRYGLTFGFQPEAIEEIFQKIENLLSWPKLRQDFQIRMKKMLSEKIDVTSFLVWFIENYPDSKQIMRENPRYADRFR
jgi:uncharacterized protein